MISEEEHNLKRKFQYDDDQYYIESSKKVKCNVTKKSCQWGEVPVDRTKTNMYIAKLRQPE